MLTIFFEVKNLFNCFTGKILKDLLHWYCFIIKFLEIVFKNFAFSCSKFIWGSNFDNPVFKFNKCSLPPNFLLDRIQEISMEFVNFAFIKLDFGHIKVELVTELVEHLKEDHILLFWPSLILTTSFNIFLFSWAVSWYFKSWIYCLS